MTKPCLGDDLYIRLVSLEVEGDGILVYRVVNEVDIPYILSEVASGFSKGGFCITLTSSAARITGMIQI